MILYRDKLLRLIKYTRYCIIIISLGVAIYIFLRPAAGVTAAVETLGDQFGISTFPANGFIKTDNMAPGDRISADLTVKNDGELDFSYDISAAKESGDDLLYNVLGLKIEDYNGYTLYTGKLNDLHNLTLGVLGRGSNQVYKFTVDFPPEIGNEYQRLGTSVTFTLNATEHPPYIEGGEIVWDPPLEKPDVHVRRGMTMPIKFHLINNGAFDTVKRGIDLVITGVNDTGQPVKYVFSITDGTLDWEEHGLNKPHYSLMFDAGKYPVKLGTYYTATVKYGSQTLGSTVFKSGN